MKLKSNIFAKWAGIIAGCASVIACSDLSELEERVDDLDSRVTALETQVENLNTSIEAIQAIAEAGNVITGITENNGEYTITTSDGKTYTLKQGESGKTPQIGINEDGNWQVRYDNGDGTWTDWTVINVGDSDTPASAVAVVPQFRVNDEGNWEISTNGGVNFNPVYKHLLLLVIILANALKWTVSALWLDSLAFISAKKHHLIVQPRPILLIKKFFKRKTERI